MSTAHPLNRLTNTEKSILALHFQFGYALGTIVTITGNKSLAGFVNETVELHGNKYKEWMSLNGIEQETVFEDSRCDLCEGKGWILLDAASVWPKPCPKCELL